jgi:hypothetical protein
MPAIGAGAGLFFFRQVSFQKSSLKKNFKHEKTGKKGRPVLKI